MVTFIGMVLVAKMYINPVLVTALSVNDDNNQHCDIYFTSDTPALDIADTCSDIAALIDAKIEDAKR